MPLVSHTNRPLSRRQWLARTGAATTALLTVPRALQAAPADSLPAVSIEPPVPVRLSANENPLGPSPSARRAMTEAFDAACRYPHGDMLSALVSLIADRERVPRDHILLGCGSGEILAMAGMAYGTPGGDVVAADPTYQGLVRYAEDGGAYIHRVPLDGEMVHDLEAMERRVTSSTSLVYVCNPNNPTGTIVPPASHRDFCLSVAPRSLVFVDEAYIDLLDDPDRHTMTDLVRDGHNVLIARTFSKIHGLAGLRIGYALARPDILDRIRPFGMGGTSVLGLHAATASLQDTAFQRTSRQHIAEGRQALYTLFEEVGYTYTPSSTNFVFFQTGMPIRDFRQRMAQRHVQVARPFPPYEDWCRVSIGTRTDMEAFAVALRAVVAETG